MTEAFGCRVKVTDVVCTRHSAPMEVPWEERPVASERVTLALLDEDTAVAANLPLARFAMLQVNANEATSIGRLALGQEFYVAFQPCPPPAAEDLSPTGDAPPAKKGAAKS